MQAATLDFRKFDAFIEVWGPSTIDGEWFLYGHIVDKEFEPTDDLAALCLKDLKQLVAYMEKL